jgi:hypothetical protein
MLLAVTPRFGIGSITHTATACGGVIFFNYQNFSCACHNQAWKADHSDEHNLRSSLTRPPPSAVPVTHHGHAAANVRRHEFYCQQQAAIQANVTIAIERVKAFIWAPVRFTS